MMSAFGSVFQALNNMRKFNRQFRCYPVALLPGNERADVERGGKIIMPPSALSRLSQLNISYPMLFKLTNYANNRVSHCGVLEFVAEEDCVFMPSWMMRNLLLREGDLVSIENILLPVATFARFQPQSQDFLDISNPKAVLENALRSFACLSAGDVFAITYNGKTYEVFVLETQPGDAVCIIECDMSVDFAPYAGYEEPMSVDGQEAGTSEDGPLDHSGFVPFSGKANILDEKKRKKLADASSVSSFGEYSRASRTSKRRGVPDYEWCVYTLQFTRNNKPLAKKENLTSINDLKPFFGSGKNLR